MADVIVNPNRYQIGGQHYPRVTSIIGAVLGEPSYGDEYYLQRGRANHACYAHIANGVQFEADPKCQPWIDGCKAFMADLKPGIIEVEPVLVHHDYRYAGRADLICMLDRKLTIVDYKNSASWRTKYQLAAYALAYEREGGQTIEQAIEIVINGDGKYHMMKPVKNGPWRLARTEWTSIRNVYGIRERHGEI